MIDWTKYPDFTKEEFTCKHSGKCDMQPAFMEKLQKLRTAFGKPMPITSGFRDKNHPNEIAKPSPGTHNEGIACDVRIQGADAVELLRLALMMGFTGIGVKQKGAGKFLHFDTRLIPMIWSY